MFSLPFMRILTPLLVVAAIVAIGAYVQLTLKQAQYNFTGPMTITVIGTGEATAVPDVATFSFSVLAEGTAASDAQKKSSDAINAITKYLKDNGVEDKDVKVQNYYMNPKYEYTQTVCTTWNCPPGKQELKGYTVTETITVKVRATDKAGELIAGIGALGATDISGLQFTIDDEDAINATARENAINDAKEKADTLAKNLGVKIVRMTGFWENQGVVSPMPYYGMGGDSMKNMTVSSEAAVAPELPVGENTVTTSVNITYEIR